MRNNPFDLAPPSTSLLSRAALAAARPLLTRVLGLETLGTLYEEARKRAARGKLSETGGDSAFEQLALRTLRIDPDCSAAELGFIPPEGPLIVAANHPHGALDGLLLAAVLRQARPDTRLLVNHLLARIPEMCAFCFFVDPFDGPKAAARSHAGLRAAHLWIRNGGALVVFPAGEVAHRRAADGSPVDSEWRSTVGRLATATGARVLPAWIEGANSHLFYAAGRVHPALRTALLARELLGKRGESVTIRFGRPLSRLAFSAGRDQAGDATQQIRAAVDAVADAFRSTTALRSAPAQAFRTVTTEPNALTAEVAALPSDALLVESGAFQVFCTGAAAIPSVLHEIGRLRALTYGMVGEGTGRQLDLDLFDQRYLHLFAWNRDRQHVVGAYRLAETDRIMAQHGVDGLYTRTLFKYDSRFIARLSPALELGRSFVRVGYQRNHNALLLLWKGIGRFIARRPEYRALFGPVSISTRYTDASHALLMAFLEQNHFDRALAELVEAVNPSVLNPGIASSAPIVARTIEEANALVSKLEQDGKGMPVLLRQYLKLKARLIGFNVDPNFGDVLDALMMVDLAGVEPSILSRYMGRDEARAFLARHRTEQLTSAAA